MLYQLNKRQKDQKIQKIQQNKENGMKKSCLSEYLVNKPVLDSIILQNVHDKNSSTSKQKGSLSSRTKVERNLGQNANSIASQSCLKGQLAKFREIQQILQRENQNLKQHRDFLVSQVRRSSDTLQIYKIKCQQHQQKINELQHERDAYKLQYLQMKTYVFQGIGKMETIFDDQQQVNRMNTVNVPTKKKIFAKQHPSNNFQRSSIQINEQLHNIVSQNVSNSSELDSNCDVRKLSEQAKKFQELNDRFEALMYEYRTTKNPQSRRKCIETAKQIRVLKCKNQVDTKQKTFDSQIQNSSNISSTLKYLDEIKDDYKIAQQSMPLRQKKILTINVDNQNIQKLKLSHYEGICQKTIINKSNIYEQIQRAHNIKS